MARRIWMKVLPLALGLGLCLSGCATQPKYPKYALPKGATVADGMRAITDCRGEAVDKFPQMVALGNPFFALAAITTVNARQTYIDDCMDGRGFHLYPHPV